MANGQSLYQIAGGVDPLAPLPSPEPYQAPKMSRGQLIAGILADALSGAAGQPGHFAAMMNQRKQQEQEDVRWGRRLEQQKRLEQQYHAPYRWEANDGSLMEMGPDGQPRLLYKDPTPKANLDPDVAVTLPNGQFYAGPRSGLAQALMGYQAPAQPPSKEELTPIDGGPTPSASGGFRY